jgi:hypothetical protein
MKALSNTVKAVCLATMLAACAPHADKIQPSYVSPLQYSDYTCKQIRMEMARISRRVNEVAGVQDKQASNDSAALGVGLILFWPALFFMIGDDQKEELSRLKGEYEAVEQAAIQKECDVAKEVDAARKLEEERKEKMKQPPKEQSQHND